MKNILIVEDRSFLLDLYASTFEEIGLIPHTAKDGEEALSIIRRETIDCVVTDYDMPVMGGVSLIHEIRSGKTSSIPVLGVSGYANDKTRELFIHEGADDFLAKPFLPDDMLNAVNRLLIGPQQLPANGMDKRRSIRYPSSGTVTLENILQLDIRDISLHGVKLCTSPGMSFAKEELPCIINLRNGLTAETKMKLVWRKPSEDIDCEFIGFAFSEEIEFHRAGSELSCVSQ